MTSPSTPPAPLPIQPPPPPVNKPKEDMSIDELLYALDYHCSVIAAAATTN